MTIKKVSVLIVANLIYALVTFCTKFASMHNFLSLEYIGGVIGAIIIMGIYAVLWQQILKLVQLSTAYMFKGLSLIFVLCISSIFFCESITTTNIIGSILLIIGITLYSYQTPS